MAPQNGLGDASIDEGVGVVWFEADRLVIVGEGVIVAPQRGLGDASIDEGVGVVEADRLVKDGVIVAPQRGLCSAPVDSRRRRSLV